MGEIGTRYWPLSKLRKWDANPKLHNLTALKASLRRYGFTMPLLVNMTTGVLIAGHGRLRALEEMKGAGEPAPERIRVEKGQWTVPVVEGVGMTDLEAEAYALDDNFSSMLGGELTFLQATQVFQEEQLAETLRRLSESWTLPVSVAEEDHRALLGQMLEQESKMRGEDFDVKAAVDARPEPRIRRGEIWRLGAHRLACGSATNEAEVERLLAGQEPLLLTSDPPYGTQTDHSWRYRALGVKGARGGRMAGDDTADWEAAWRIWPARVLYVWHGAAHAVTVRGSLENSGYEIRQQIVWVKPKLVLSRSHYHWRHELLYYCVRKGMSANWRGGRAQTTVWEFNSPIASGARGEDDAATLHPTQKPLGVYEIPIRNHTLPGDIVADPFVGSGTCIIACERLQRRCVAMDIDPKWAEICIQRWEAFTGEQAVLEASGDKQTQAG